MGFYCYKKGLEACEKRYPNHRDPLHSDYRGFLVCTSSVTGVIARGIGWSTDPVGSAAGEIGEQTGRRTCEQCE